MGGTKAKIARVRNIGKGISFFFYLKLKYMDTKLSLVLARSLIFPFLLLCYLIFRKVELEKSGEGNFHWSCKINEEILDTVKEGRKILHKIQRNKAGQNFNLQAPCVLYIGDAFRYSPECDSVAFCRTCNKHRVTQKNGNF